MVRVVSAEKRGVSRIGLARRDIVGFNSCVFRGVCFGVRESCITIYLTSVTYSFISGSAVAYLRRAALGTPYFFLPFSCSERVPGHSSLPLKGGHCICDVRGLLGCGESYAWGQMNEGCNASSRILVWK